MYIHMCAHTHIHTYIPTYIFAYIRNLQLTRPVQPRAPARSPLQELKEQVRRTCGFWSIDVSRDKNFAFLGLGACRLLALIGSAVWASIIQRGRR